MKRILDTKGELNNRKLDLLSPLAQPSKCPECASEKIWKDGRRKTGHGDVQRWLCRDCGYRFSLNGSRAHSEPLRKPSRWSINNASAYTLGRQVCEFLTEGSKNLIGVESRLEKAAGATTTTKGKIVEFAWWLKKQGYSQRSVQTYSKRLKRLLNLGANLTDPENVKEVIAQQEWDENTKLLATTVYSCFIENTLGITWKPPRYRKQEKIPHVPTEEDIDQLIAGSGKKLSTFLQLTKETGMRCGEAIRLEWTEIDFKQRILRIRSEKGGLPRVLPISAQLETMLQNLPKTSTRIFPGTMNSMRCNLQTTRKRLTRKLSDPRLLRVTFHSIRHWKGTNEYHKTKDVMHVKRILGHRAIRSTMLYINLENALFTQGKAEDFHVKVAHDIEEACKLIEVGFEYVTGEYSDGGKIFRKRK